ncbi:malate/lactate/ureidoglycolate dehydrogenase [Burkholderia multivorans]|uniref:malate/lactate/ureidoglycolate dehydrogenase n=1 Tax=Burkholderia multivorans TaxID=87883 RepID=UPI001C22803D|nr:malate/lactate/ureidoglycolate dehydrogenase [Burkholderia multivorans]MBU9221985.1 malate/lactate/ureidoglycolate dehydrogenase [Burkholderia multivorans]MBU9419083.1 malate/lactate/ureidoglycolate dehydrogenase [Burkholderia multivorans]MBU9662382.1 malate/lactate/ureidoglycolate dehydrogenase [Burkholderia multivorans]
MTVPPTADTDLLRMGADPLHAFVAALWERAGSHAREARLVADHLVGANLAGHDSHGIGMIPNYVAAWREGGLRLNGHASIVRDGGAVLTIDGGRGFGQVVAFEAMVEGIERARRIGICAIGLRDVHHLGRIGHWAEQCARAGLVSFHFVNVPGDLLVAPLHGTDARFGTNPFCAAYPRAGKPPLLLDFATSAIAYGKTRVAYNQGRRVPAGSLIDHRGQPTDDPAVMHVPPFGALLPFGLHKGYALAAMCELFGGALVGGHTTYADTVQKTSAIVNGMLSVLIDPNAFDAADAAREADAFVEWAKASPPAGDEPVRMPGEPEEASRAARTAAGIPVDRATWRQIRDSAAAVGFDEAELDAWTRRCCVDA